MQRKLASYVLLSLLSFSVFTTLFHTVVNAQTSELIAAPTPTVSPFGATSPVTAQKAPQVMFTLTSTDEPFPTTAQPEPTTTHTPKLAVAGPEELESHFNKYADEYKIDKEDLKRIAKCEAGFNTNADTGVYAGMYQFAAATWISTRNAMGLDTNPDLRKNAEEAIRTAAYKILNGGRGAWPNC